MEKTDLKDDVDCYFKSYENFEVHRLMLEDRPRTEAYKNAILSSKIFEDKVVMDVGAGTGILSIFCAQAGAKKVYAVEASNLAHITKSVVKENNWDNIIEVLHSRVEELSEDIQVDIIVSEWMGFFLLHESMIDSVICARDKHLKPGGLMYPERAVINCSPCSTPRLLDYWTNVYSVQMTAMKEAVRKCLATKPEITTLTSDDVLCEPRTVLDIDLNTVAVTDVTHVTSRVFVSTHREGLYQGLAIWFDVTFPGEEVLSTAPSAPVTHWKQTVVVLPQDQLVEEGDVLGFELRFERDSAADRRYFIHMRELDAAEDEHPVPCECGCARCNIVRAFLAKCDDGDSDECDMPSEQT